SENLHAGNQTFRARSREPFQPLGIVPFAEKKLCVEGQFGLIRAVSFVGIKVCYCHSLWQEIHLSVQINSPEKSNIEQQVCRLACDDPTEHGRAEHVCDYVVLVLRCFELSPVHCSLVRPPQWFSTYCSYRRRFLAATNANAAATRHAAPPVTTDKGAPIIAATVPA